MSSEISRLSETCMKKTDDFKLYYTTEQLEKCTYSAYSAFTLQNMAKARLRCSA